MHSAGHQAVELRCQDGVGWITLNRPEAINAINMAMRRELPAALRMFDDDPQIRVIVVRGADGRGFCAGADLKEQRPASVPDSPSAGEKTSSWIEAFDQIATPVIAAIHGFCLGGGLEIALACDLRVASDDAVFALPETALGLIPGGGGTQRLPRLVGLSRALDLLITGERIDATEAYRIGLISRLIPGTAQMFDATAELAGRIAQRPPTAIRYVKQAAKTGITLPLDAGFRLEKDLFTRLLTTEERQEALAAFREKRPPVFRSSQGDTDNG